MKPKNALYHYIYIVAAMVLAACSDEIVPAADNSAKQPIHLSAGFRNMTRATDTGFCDGDRMGIYIVDHADGKPQSLACGRLHADNVLFTFHEAGNEWEGATRLFWNDKTTPADFYGYYPFDAAMVSPTAYAFSVKTKQNTSATPGSKGGYEASDLMRAKTDGVAPTSERIELTYSHLMAGVTIRLQEGEGFAEGEWGAAEKMAWVDNVLTDCVVDIETAEVVPNGETTAKIQPLLYDGSLRAVVVPQVVAAGKALIAMTVNGQNYSLTKNAPFTYTSGKMHTFTIRVDKRAESGDYEFSLTDETISAWIDDPDFHDGIVREYVCVHVETPGTLSEVIKSMNLMPESIESMKLTGTINGDDRNFIGYDMPNLMSLNAGEVINEDEDFGIPSGVWMGGGHIVKVIYPKSHLKSVGGIGPLVGKQIIPEGVEHINGFYMERGEIVFPSTLKTMGSVGQYSGIYGELQIPEGVEEIGSLNGDFSGELILPASLKKIGTIRYGHFTGGLVIPQGIKQIETGAFETNTFAGTLTLPEGLEKIGEWGFGYHWGKVGFKGELKLPSTLKTISHGAFANNYFTKIIWPKGLSMIGDMAFMGCDRLTGTINVPDKITSIPLRAFEGCSMLTGIELHKDISYIGERAFAGCNYVNSIVCHAEEPPVFEDNTFDGLSLGDVVVEVPAASVPIYQQDSRWKRFKRITAYSNFVCRPQKACALNNAREQAVTLNADGAWSVTHKPDWCSVSQTSGTGKTSLVVSIDEMAQGCGDREDYIEFTLDGKGFTTRCNVSQHDYEYADDQLIPLQTHTRGRGIKILMLGDGWDGQKIADGSYMQQCRDNMEYFFGLPPYDRLRDYFDVYAAVSLSQESGVNTPNTYLDTRFGTIYGGGEGAMSNLLPDEDLLFPYIKDELGFTHDDLWRGLTILIPNTTDYSGGTYFFGNYAVSVCPPSANPYPNDTRGVVQHEACGHGFGKLGDENISRNAFAPNSVKGLVNEMHGRGWYMNLASTGKMSDVPWTHLIFDPRYSDYVDIFEGGYGYTRGIYRSEANSCMNYGIPYFNAISRQDITKRVKEAAGEWFNIEEFYANDTKRWGASSNSSGGSTRAGGNGSGYSLVPISNPAPVFVQGSELRNQLKELREKQSKNNK